VIHRRKEEGNVWKSNMQVRNRFHWNIPEFSILLAVVQTGPYRWVDFTPFLWPELTDGESIQQSFLTLFIVILGIIFPLHIILLTHRSMAPSTPLLPKGFWCAAALWGFFCTPPGQRQHLPIMSQLWLDEFLVNQNPTLTSSTPVIE